MVKSDRGTQMITVDSELVGSPTQRVADSRRARKKEEVRRRIGRAAVELFRERGYEAATVEEIAERADVAKGTVFNYFPRKEALLEVAGLAMLEDLRDRLGAVTKWRGTARQQLRRLYMSLAEVAEHDPELARAILSEHMTQVHRPLEDDEVGESVREMMRSVIATGQDRGEIRKDLDVEQVVQVLQAAHFVSLVVWLASGAPAAQLGREITAKLDLIFEGVGAAVAPRASRKQGRVR